MVLDSSVMNVSISQIVADLDTTIQGVQLVIPAFAALIAANYVDKDRALAYGVIGGVAGAAVAAGPLIGGWVTTTFSWRYVFVGEVVVVIAILIVHRRMKRARK